jgi:hypothetical protein
MAQVVDPRGKDSTCSGDDGNELPTRTVCVFVALTVAVEPHRSECASQRLYGRAAAAEGFEHPLPALR